MARLLLQLMVHLAPALTKQRTMPLPMPLPLPVTIKTFPVRSNGAFMVFPPPLYALKP